MRANFIVIKIDIIVKYYYTNTQKIRFDKVITFIFRIFVYKSFVFKHKY